MSHLRVPAGAMVVVMQTRADDRGPLTARLIEWQRGDRGAGDRLFAGLSSALRPFVCSLVGGPTADADDLLQDVFVTFVTKAPAFEVTCGDSGLLAWFRLSLKRRWWAMAKRAGRQIAVGLEVDRLTDVNTDVDRRIETRQRLEALDRASADADRVAIRAGTREQVSRLVDHVAGVVLAGAPAVRSKGALAERFGWSPSQLWRIARRLESAVRPGRPAAERRPTRTTRPPRTEVRATVSPPAPVAEEAHPSNEPGRPVRRWHRSCVRRPSCVPSERYRTRNGPP